MIIYKGLGVPDRNQAHRNMGFFIASCLIIAIFSTRYLFMVMP